jgi:glycosyltransferase involved in cell wall biosynthesis
MNPGSSAPPMVSIVINNYNYGRFLRECIDSALSQTYPHTEVIVVDDGSTDDSTEIIESYGDQLVSILKENGGQASAFNAGFAASRGEILILLDADDLLRSGAAERVAEMWRPGLAKVQYRLEVINAAGQSQGILIPPGKMPSGNLRDLVLSSVIYTAPPTSGNAFARQVLDQLLPMPEEEWRISADGYLLSLSPFLGDVASLHEVLGSYRFHGSNNYAMEELDLHKLREIVVQDVQKQELIREFAGRMGLKVNKDPILRVPEHVKARLASLRLDPGRHPFPKDRPHILALRGINACRLSHDVPFRKRFSLCLWFVLVASFPKSVMAPVITLGLMPHKRPRFLATFFR